MAASPKLLPTTRQGKLASSDYPLPAMRSTAIPSRFPWERHFDEVIPSGGCSIDFGHYRRTVLPYYRPDIGAEDDQGEFLTPQVLPSKANQRVRIRQSEALALNQTLQNECLPRMVTTGRRHIGTSRKRESLRRCVRILPREVHSS
jgi:hypothetical protein